MARDGEHTHTNLGDILQVLAGTVSRRETRRPLREPEAGYPRPGEAHDGVCGRPGHGRSDEMHDRVIW